MEGATLLRLPCRSFRSGVLGVFVFALAILPTHYALCQNIQAQSEPVSEIPSLETRSFESEGSNNNVDSDRGKYLVTIAACGYCHGADPDDPLSPLSGGRILEDSYGKVEVPNITSDKDTGIGRWTVLELRHAIRSSIGRKGEYLSIDAHQGYRWLSDQDVQEISEYLLRTEPAKSDSERRKVSAFTARKWGLFSQHEIVRGYVPSISESAGGYYGMYLVSHLASCARCHSPKESVIDSSGYLAGSKGIRFRASTLFEKNKVPQAPSIRNTEDGISALTDDDIVRFLKRGKGLTPESESRICPTPYYSFMTTRDVQSVIKYLRSLE
jgi:cytochrome c553